MFGGKSPAGEGQVVQTSHRGQAISFFVVNPKDVIQSCHAKGEFYELEELAIIEKYFPKGGTFLDIGSNIGNHLVYVGKFLQPRQIIAVEPNPPAIAMLRKNITLNGLDALIDASLLELGLSDAEGTFFVRVGKSNLGGAKLKSRTLLSMLRGKAKIRAVPGDSILGDRTVDFIKMDVEGMELRALDGLMRVIERNRPPMFIEVDVKNQTGFNAFVERIGYTVKERFKRYPENENFLVVSAT